MKNLSYIRRVLFSGILLVVAVSPALRGCGFTSEVKNARPVPEFTVPPKDPQLHYVQFIAVGDAGTGGDGQAEVAGSMARKAAQDSVSFVLVLGDNFYESGVTSIYDEQWQTKFEKMYWHPSLQVPFYAVLGNHDYRRNPQAQVEYTSVSKRWRMPDRYYTFVQSIDDSTGIQFFCIDTSPLTSRAFEEGDTTDKSKPAPQLRWLEAQLHRSNARWKIVMGHHMMYSGGVHGDNEELTSMLEPLFIKYKVDMYLSGHDHHLELLKPMNGVHHIISGGGGKHRSVTWRDNTIYAATNLGFVSFRVSPGDVLVEFLSREGKLGFAHLIHKQ